MELVDLSYSDLEKWWTDYQEEQKSWGGILEEPYPELLTTWYAQSVLVGDIPASKENKLAAQRHLNDLERQGDDDFPWVFKEELGHRPIRFIEENCKPTEGTFNRFVLQPWQHFVIGSLFGWVHKDTGIRRFREGLVFVGRKNGKTSLISGLSSYMLGYDGEPGANVYVLANSKEQASILYDKTSEMVKKSPRLDRKYNTTSHFIKDESTFSKMEPRASDSKRLDGLNTHFAVFDEIHEFKDFKLINVIKKSRGTRSQPLIMYITTAGYVLDGPLIQFYDSGKDALEHLDDDLDERTFYFLAKLDSPEEADKPELWIKANPNIGLMSFVDLVSDWKTEKKSPAERADWMTKQFNLFSDIDELSYVDMPTIEKNSDIINEEELIGKTAVGGFDLSDTEDFTAAVLEFPLDDGRIYLKTMSWIPQARYDKDNNQQRLDMWIKNGELEVIPGNYVNHEYVYDWFVKQSEKYDIKQINYDPAKALALNNLLMDYGFVTEKVRQGFVSLGGPMQSFKELLLDGKVVFNNSRIFRWYLSNVKLVTDRNNNWMPTKQSKNRKIDGFAATLNAHGTVLNMMSTASGNADIGFISVKDMF